MAKHDLKTRPSSTLEHYLWTIGRTGITHDIELARIIAEQQNVPEDRVQLFLGRQMIIIDPLFLKEKKLLQMQPGFVRNFHLYFAKRKFHSRSMRLLLEHVNMHKLIKK